MRSEGELIEQIVQAKVRHVRHDQVGGADAGGIADSDGDMPHSRAAAMPASASSKTTHWAGGTFSLPATQTNRSGAGLVRLTE